MKLSGMGERCESGKDKFVSWQDAEAKAVEDQQRYGQDGGTAWRPYPCELCGWWHLTKKDRVKNKRRRTR